MDAVVGELVENGYPGASVERIAARAGVAKTTIYRRWGGLDGLLAAVMAEHAAREIPVPDLGDLDADLRALARQIVSSLRDPAIKAAFTMIVAAAVQDQAARDLLAEFLNARVDRMSVIVHRAVQRGEVPPDTDAAQVLLTVTALVYHRIFLAGEELGTATADRAAAIAAAAARAGAITATAATETLTPGRPGRRPRAARRS